MPVTLSTSPLPYQTLLNAILSLHFVLHPFLHPDVFHQLQAALRQFAAVVSSAIPDEDAWRELALVRRHPAGPKKGEGNTYQVVLVNAVKAISEEIRLGMITTAKDVRMQQESLQPKPPSRLFHPPNELAAFSMWRRKSVLDRPACL
ncbi:hypothetical protein JCM8547_007855 [Rhodosporidiobolus lusitaniae]